MTSYFDGLRLLDFDLWSRTTPAHTSRKALANGSFLGYVKVDHGPPVRRQIRRRPSSLPGPALPRISDLEVGIPEQWEPFEQWLAKARS
jgi:hypothetical protein